MRKSPLMKVKEQFGSKEALAGKLAPLLRRPEDEPEEEFERRLRTTSNRKLLRLWEAEERTKALGGRDAVIDFIMKAKFGERPEAAFRTRLEGYANTRLLDLHARYTRAAKRAG
ncbi:MAG: hypothetical protein EA398_10310 [Deltaproteobacteria bacterium]|nr:MAG: hypothetical protein EA398_10310 [Deltaproteobacteria bacterium]